jgi:hypothetical protein
MICGPNQAGVSANKTSGTYDIVGMIHSYNLDRQEVVSATAGTGEVIDGPSNPLAALIASGNQAAGEILEIVTDLELEKPPYDINDSGDSIYATTQKLLRIPSTNGVVRGSMFVPAGLLQVYNTLDAAVVVKIEVVAEVLCKDMA